MARATVTDLMGRETTLKAERGRLPLTLSDRVQYVTVPHSAWTRGIAVAELKRRLEGLGLADSAAIQGARSGVLEMLCWRRRPRPGAPG